MTKQKLERLTTPVGIAQFPYLSKPDDYKGTLKYKTNLILDETDPFVTELRDRAEQALNRFEQELEASLEDSSLTGKKRVKVKDALANMELSLPFEPEYNDEGEETGRVILKTASHATYKDKHDNIKERVLPIFDSKGIRLTKSPNIWSGSKLRLSVDVYPFHMLSTDLAGVSLRIAGVQIVELQSVSGASADDLGFGHIDGGFTSNEDEDDAEACTTTDDTFDDDEEF